MASDITFSAWYDINKKNSGNPLVEGLTAQSLEIGREKSQKYLSNLSNLSNLRNLSNLESDLELWRVRQAWLGIAGS